MKKLMSFMLAVLMLLTLAACSGNGGQTANATQAPTEAPTAEPTEAINPYTIANVITNEGNSVTISFDELIATYDSNEARFDKLYKGAKITFTGTVQYIKTNTSVCAKEGKVYSGQSKIVFEEGWCLIIGDGNNDYDLADYDAGDVLEVTTSILGAPYDSDFLQKVSDHTRVLWLIGTESVQREPNPSNVSTKTVITKKS